MHDHVARRKVCKPRVSEIPPSIANIIRVPTPPVPAPTVPAPPVPSPTMVNQTNNTVINDNNTNISNVNNNNTINVGIRPQGHEDTSHLPHELWTSLLRLCATDPDAAMVLMSSSINFNPAKPQNHNKFFLPNPEDSVVCKSTYGDWIWMSKKKVVKDLVEDNMYAMEQQLEDHRGEHVTKDAKAFEKWNHSPDQGKNERLERFKLTNSPKLHHVLSVVTSMGSRFMQGTRPKLTALAFWMIASLTAATQSRWLWL